MKCTSPIDGWYSRHLTKNGKRAIVFNPDQGFKDMPITVPCGRCAGCRLKYSAEWALRCVHEAQMHEQNAFITLTYNNENLPENYSVSKRELQLFFKRLRENTGQKLRYFACGEYGDESGRPHYHAIIFGQDFTHQDRELNRYPWTVSKKSGEVLFRSPILEKSWTLGHSSVGAVNFETAAYVARYTMKKRRGDDSEIDPKTGKTNAEHYMVADPDTGELHHREREFCIMSRGTGNKDDPPGIRFGIGAGWLYKYKNDTIKDYVTANGHTVALPKYYDSLLKKLDGEKAMLKRKAKRKQNINEEENTLERLAAKAKCTDEKLKKLKRTSI